MYKKKNVVLIVGGFPSKKDRKIYGGQVTACMSLLNSSYTEFNTVITLDTTQISNPIPLFPIRLVLAIVRFFKFISILFIRRPDATIIFMADGFSAIEKGLMAYCSRALKVPVMVFPRAGKLIQQYFSSYWFAVYIRATLGKSDIFLCQGSTFQNFAKNELGFTSENAPVIPNWTASNYYIDIGITRDHCNIIAKPQLLFLGWLEESKGVFDLLNACRILCNNKVDFHLIFAGNGTALSKAKLFVDNHNLTNYVTFCGWVDGNKKIDLLKNSQIFVLPSWNEGLPNAMIEAMSAGLACVVTRVGMIPDYMVDKNNALIVEKKNPIALANALRLTICDFYLRKFISKNSFELAKSRFTLDNGVKLLCETTSKICQKKYFDN
jgi:glycosyltransferase involved in cell wall biosynthesis